LQRGSSWVGVEGTNSSLVVPPHGFHDMGFATLLPPQRCHPESK
jgi:hypothetical protein